MSGTVTIGKVRLVDEYVSDQIDSIEQGQLAVSGRMTAVEQAVATMDSAAVSNRVATAEDNIAALESQDAVLASATTAVSNRLTTAEQEIDALEEEDIVLAIATTAVSNRLTTAEQDIDALVSATTAVSTRVTGVEQDISALESEDVALASATTAVSNRVTAVEQDVADAGSDISALETDWNSFKSVAYVSGGTSLIIDRGNDSNTILSTNDSNYIRGNTYFRIENETTSKAFISSGGFYARATDSTTYHVADTLQDLLARVAALEALVANTLSHGDTVSILNGMTGEYLWASGSLEYNPIIGVGPNNTSSNAQFTVYKTQSPQVL